MYKVGVCGHFGEGKNLLNGQTVKTKLIAEELKVAFPSQLVGLIDTHGWKSNPILLLIKCVLLIKNSENIIILPAQNGVSVLLPLFLIINKLFHRKLHYVVIGGWLPELLVEDHKLKSKVSRFDGVYVETHSMIKALNKIGLDNVNYLPNFKRLKIVEENDLNYIREEPFRLCTFSRVMKEKGIEDAIKSVKLVNSFFGRKIYTLDIYGQVDEKYKERFDELIKDFPDFISYKGVVNFDESVEVLKDYFALLFPTFYKGEGFAGTILDAYAAGVPVIATNWRYNGEIIKEKYDGLLYDYKENKKLQEILIDIQLNPDIINNMRKNCLKRAKEYTPETVINSFIKYL